MDLQLIRPLNLTELAQRPPEISRMPLHRIRVRQEAGDSTIHAYLLGRNEERELIVMLADRYGEPSGHAAILPPEDVVEDAAAAHQPAETPDRALALRAAVQDKLDRLALERA